MEINKEIKRKVNKWMTEQTKTRKKAGLLTNEQEDINVLLNTVSKDFFSDKVVYPSGYGNEAEWSFWKGKAVNLQA